MSVIVVPASDGNKGDAGGDERAKIDFLREVSTLQAMAGPDLS